MKVKNFFLDNYTEGKLSKMENSVIVEEPLEIYVNGKGRFFCMRLPGHEKELAVGLCFNDHLIERPEDIKSIKEYKEDSNRIEVELFKEGEEENVENKIIKSSSGFVSGSDLADFYGKAGERISVKTKIKADMILRLEEDLKQKQQIYKGTGGAHATAIYDKSGENISFAEDVGRHNAFDKAIGSAILKDKKEDSAIAILSSRLSYEMVSKACRLGVEIAAGISAPTSLAVEIARKRGLTLIGFLRNKGYKIYSYPERIME